MPFKTTKLDLFVTLVISVLFLYALIFSSYKPARFENGTLMRSEEQWRETGDDRVPTVNLFVVIAPIILIYEFVQIVILPGKPRLREINKRAYIIRFRAKIRDKIDEGKRLTKEYFDRKKR